jgi:hypothetical protein
MVHAPLAPTEAPATATVGYRVIFDRIFTAALALFAAAVLVQVFLAGLGTFHTRGNSGPGFGPHEVLGNALGITASVIMIISFVAHISARVVICSIVLAVLTEVAQHGLAQFGWTHQYLGALHALDGVIILLLAVGLLVGAVRRNNRGARNS